MCIRTFSPVAVLVSHGVTTERRLALLSDLNLTNTKRKLMEPAPEGKAWSQAQADEAEKWYKRYLAIIIKYPDATRHVPNGPIDEFWHQHILDTIAYRKDCADVLGYFLDHYPYFGLNGDVEQRDTAFDDTNELYRLMFGEDCTQMTFGVKTEGNTLVNVVNSGVRCGNGCRGQGCSRGCTRSHSTQV